MAHNPGGGPPVWRNAQPMANSYSEDGGYAPAAKRAAYGRELSGLVRTPMPMPTTIITAPAVGPSNTAYMELERRNTEYGGRFFIDAYFGQRYIASKQGFRRQK